MTSPLLRRCQPLTYAEATRMFVKRYAVYFAYGAMVAVSLFFIWQFKTALDELDALRSGNKKAEVINEMPLESSKRLIFTPPMTVVIRGEQYKIQAVISEVR